MADVMRSELSAGQDGETPVNPYSLLEAVNDSSENAHVAWLIFLAVMIYLMVAVAGVTHKDLLMQTPLALPVLQVQIQQTQFFQFAPVVLVLMHMGLISQLVLLSRKTLEFDAAVRALEATDRRTHPLRLELHNFFFVQAVAGPHRSIIMSAFLHAMSWLSIVILPVILMLYIQITFLPYHDLAVTWTHRLALLIDIAVLLLIGIFLLRAETSFFSALAMTGRYHPGSLVATIFVLAAAAFFAFLVATVPGEPLDRLAQAVSPARPAATTARSGGAANVQQAGFSVPFFGARADGSLFGMFHRNLIVTDVELGSERSKDKDEVTLNMRGRDLRYARLDRSSLPRVDLTGADLDGASLAGADLRGARLQCADIGALLLTEDRAGAHCPTARGANLKGARLTGAHLAGLDLTGAVLDEAQLDGADLSSALLVDASFSGANLDKANLASAQGTGANFLVASLRGADATGAQFQGADFTSASMQGAVMTFAGLEGATLRDTDFEAADLSAARLQGADLTGSRIKAADLRGARIWLTRPAAGDGLQLADLSSPSIAALDQSEISALSARLARIDNPALKARVTAALATLTTAAEQYKWAGSRDQQQWQAFVEASKPAIGEGYRGALTEHLARLMCRSRWAAGAIASGVATRALSQQFRGDMVAIYDRLKSKDCPAGEAVPARIMQRLTAAVDAARDK